MNFKEGMRRVGILLGVIGAIIGGVASFEEASRVWRQHVANRQFERALAVPAVQKIPTSARTAAIAPEQGVSVTKQRGNPWDRPVAPSVKEDWFEANKPKEAETGSRERHMAKPWEKYQQRWWENDPIVQGTVQVNAGGINSVTIDGGLVSTIELSTGESVQRTASPALYAYFQPLLYPLLGFFLPWGAIRALTWIGVGFFEPKAPVA